MSHEPAGGRLAPDAPRPSRRTLAIVAIVALVLAAVVVVLGLLSRAGQATQLKTWTQTQAIPVVAVVSPIAEVGERSVSLPGSLQPWYRAQIFARVGGYVRMWYDDIGAKVRAGQVLAVIDTPELDAQIVQARADLASALAAQHLSQITAARWAGLLESDAVSKQESDEKAGDLEVKTAAVDAARANLDRLLALKGFSRITAPFAGVVTARRTDIGALVNAGAGASASSELFEVSKIDPLRLYVEAPQAYVSQIGPSDTVTLTVPEHPGQAFPARMTTTSNAVSQQSGTLQVELTVDNRAGALKAGDYAQVRFQIPAGAGPAMLRVPSSALLFRKTGTQLALLGAGERAHIVPVVVGRDLGQTIEITRGLSSGDRVIDNPPDSITEGELVRVAPSTQRSGNASGA